LDEYYSNIRKILRIILILNLIVAAVKIYYGFQTNILSMVTDGYDSLFDGVANVIGIFAIMIASRPPNDKQQYGYSKVETFSAIIISVLLFITGYSVLSEAIGRFYGIGMPTVTLESFIVLAATLAINIPVAVYEYRKGNELNSPILISDSKHTLVDVFITAAVLVSLIFMKMGYTIVDPVLSVIIAILILNTGISILLENIKVLLDTTVLENDKIEKIIQNVDGVKGVSNIRSRGPQSNVFVDLHLILDGSTNVETAEKIKNNCKDDLKKNFSEIKDIVIEIDAR
jgi:cation diffusion facilitator family transporter